MKPASTSKQATLGKFGFTKKIERARGNCFKVQLDFVPECENSPLVYHAKKDGVNLEFPKPKSPAKETRKAKGSSKRRSYTIYFKLNVLRDFETAAKSKNSKDKCKEVAEKYQMCSHHLMLCSQHLVMCS
eukprot:gene12460-13749_t